jgi:glycosyltransferase involved in cell wall biosynthesis
MVLPVSVSVERTIRRYAGDRVRTEVVPVGVDADRFRPSGGTRDHERILFVGFVNYMKGIDVLLRAMRLLADRGSTAHLVLVGGAHYRNTMRQEHELRSLVPELRLQDRVTFAGSLPPVEVARLMSESALLVLPSRAESFGAVLVEALACGTPVVATRCGGPEDIVTPKVGELVPPEDPQALADAIHSVLSRRVAYAPIELRDYALTRFGLDTVVERTYSAYLAIDDPPAPPVRPRPGALSCQDA